MTDKESPAQKTKINKAKVYGIALVLFLLVNFGFETLITIVENSSQQWLYPIFPYTRIGLLIITILAANYYIRRRLGKPKPKLWWRIMKPALLILVAYGLTMGAWLSVSQVDADRAAAEAQKASQSIQNLQVPTKTEINTNYGAN